MTLQDLAFSLGQVAIHYNPLNGYYGTSSIGQLNTTQLLYPAMALVPSGDIVQRKGFNEFNMTFYVIDRLLTDSANDFDIYSFSVETLKNFFKQLRTLPKVVAVTEEPVIRLFHNERDNDRVCGAYSTVALTIEDDFGCPDWLDIDPSSGVTPLPETKVIGNYKFTPVTSITELDENETYVFFDPQKNLINYLRHKDYDLDAKVFSGEWDAKYILFSPHISGNTFYLTTEVDGQTEYMIGNGVVSSQTIVEKLEIDNYARVCDKDYMNFYVYSCFYDVNYSKPPQDSYYYYKRYSMENVEKGIKEGWATLAYLYKVQEI